MVSHLVAVGLLCGALGGCGATPLTADGGGTGGGAGAGAAGGASGGAGGAVAVDAGDGADPCAALAGHLFISVNLLNCDEGINPMAPPCNWTVSFKTAEDFSYAKAGADVYIDGTYVCAGGIITGTPTSSIAVIHGTYGGPGTELIWDGQRFHS
jgi:hypothetical protein